MIQRGVIHLSGIMLIEDDTSLFQEIKERLADWDYVVNGVQDFSDDIMKDFTN